LGYLDARAKAKTDARAKAKATADPCGMTNKGHTTVKYRGVLGVEIGRTVDRESAIWEW
jgi:hypothetical protein